MYKNSSRSIFETNKFIWAIFKTRIFIRSIIDWISGEKKGFKIKEYWNYTLALYKQKRLVRTERVRLRLLLIFCIL